MWQLNLPNETLLLSRKSDEYLTNVNHSVSQQFQNLSHYIFDLLWQIIKHVYQRSVTFSIASIIFQIEKYFQDHSMIFDYFLLARTTRTRSAYLAKSRNVMLQTTVSFVFNIYCRKRVEDSAYIWADESFVENSSSVQVFYNAFVLSKGIYYNHSSCSFPCNSGTFHNVL